jgi:hypothetical protein
VTDSKSQQDQEHLRLLSIFHYIVGGLTALFGLIPLFHLTVGLMVMFSPGTFSGKPGEAPPMPPPAWFGLLFALLGGFFFLAAQSLAVCTILSGRYLAKRIRYMFIFVPLPDVPIRTVDIMPSILECLGITPPNGVDGVSFSKLAAERQATNNATARTSL